MTGFHLRALESVRGVEVAGITSRTPPDAVAATVRDRGLGECRVFDSVREMAHEVDVVAIFNPNFARVAVMEELARAVSDGARLRGLICEKPLARNLVEAHRVVELAREIGAPTAYFENQIHMKIVQQARAQLEPVVAAMGPLTLARGGGARRPPQRLVLGSRAAGRRRAVRHGLSLTRGRLVPAHAAGTAARYLEPETVVADVGLLKWGRNRWRAELAARFGVDYAATPAEDFATGVVTYRDPETVMRSKAQFTVSWMYDKQGLRLLVDGLGPGYALEVNTLRSPLEVFVGDAAAASVGDAELALEKSTASQGLLAVQPNEPDLYGYTDEHVDALAAFRAGRDALLDFEYGLDIVRLTMAAYLSAEGRRAVDLTDDETRARLDTYVPLIQQGRGAEVL